MELWVRSQNRKWFGKVDKLHIISDCIYADGILIGDYSATKACCKVLDEIQRSITTAKCNIIIYEMPQE